MRHLVTGGSGFLGHLIVKHLALRQEEVISLDTWEASGLPAGVKFIKGSVLDADCLNMALKSVDIVHHTAALVPLTKAGHLFHEVNVEGSRLTAELAAQAGVKCFVFLSSSAIYGAPLCPVTTTTPTKPVEIYGASKLLAEQTVTRICKEKAMPLIAIRPRTIVGSGRLGIFQVLFDWIKNDINVYVIGSGQNKIQFLHAQDLIDCYLMLLEQNQPGFYNVGTDSFSSLETTLKNLINHAHSRSKVKHLPKELTIATLATLDVLKLSPLAPWHYLTYAEDFYFDLEPITKLGFKPKYSNDTMMAECYDEFVSHYDILRKEKSASAHRRPLKEQALALLKLVSRF
jgi:nucleoside-diphosphate-sugar epimerase